MKDFFWYDNFFNTSFLTLNKNVLKMGFQNEFLNKKNPGNLWKNIVGKVKKFQVVFRPPALNRVKGTSWCHLKELYTLLKN